MLVIQGFNKRLADLGLTEAIGRDLTRDLGLWLQIQSQTDAVKGDETRRLAILNLVERLARALQYPLAEAEIWINQAEDAEDEAGHWESFSHVISWCLFWLAECQPQANDQKSIADLTRRFKSKAEACAYASNLSETKSLEILDLAERLARAMQDPLAEALVWRGRANVFQVKERYEESLHASEEAVTFYRQYGLPFDEAVASVVQVVVLGVIDRFEEAIALAKWIKPHFEIQENEPPSEATTFKKLAYAYLAANLGQVYTRAWRLNDAEHEYNVAYRLYRDLKKSLEAACVLQNLAVATCYADDLNRAEDLLKLCYPELEATKSISVQIKARISWAEVMIRCDRYKEALEHLAYARDLMAQDITNQTHHPDSGYVDFYEARVYKALQQPFQAEKLLRNALICFQDQARVIEAAETLIELSTLYSTQGVDDKLAQALDDLSTAERALEHRDAPELKARILLERATCILHLGQLNEALYIAQLAMEQFRRRGLRMQRAQAMLVAANASQSPDSACALYQSALNLAGKDLPLLAARCWRGLGQQSAHPESAHQAYLQAATLLEMLDRWVPIAIGKTRFLKDRQTLYHEALQKVNPHDVSAVWTWCDRSRAAMLASLLEGELLTSDIEPALSEKLVERDHLVRCLIYYGDRPLSLGDVNSVRSHDAYESFRDMQLRKIRESIQTLDIDLTAHSHPAELWRQGLAITLDRARALLDAQTAFVAYYPIGDHLYALIVTNVVDTIVTRLLPVGYTELTNQVNATHALLAQANSTHEAVQTMLGHLWKALLAPLQVNLVDKARLIIIPYEELHQVPFAALYNTAQCKYAFEHWAMQMVPSAGLLDWCQRQPTTLKIAGPKEPVALGGVPPYSGWLKNICVLIYAGAAAVLSNLWHVNDTKCLPFLHEFHIALANGQSSALALQHAQRQIMQTPELAHPHVWASFVLIGDSRKLG